MNTIKQNLIAITGVDGSGKSTLCNALQQKLHNSKILTIWDGLKDFEMNGSINKVAVFQYINKLNQFRQINLFYSFFVQGIKQYI